MKIKANKLAFILNTLQKENYCIVDNLFPKTLIDELLERADHLYKNHFYQEAKVGKEKTLAKTIRSDLIYWWNFEDLLPSEKRYFKYLKMLQKILNRTFFLGTNNIEIFYSLYQPGCFYVKHYDNFKHSNERKITFITYLNKNWKRYDDFNGELKIYLKEASITIEPLFNRSILFFSEFVPHEVLPTKEIRYAITSWFTQKKMA